MKRATWVYQKPVYMPTITFTHIVNFDNSANIHMVQRPKTRIDINNGPPWKPKTSDLNFRFVSDSKVRPMYT